MNPKNIFTYLSSFFIDKTVFSISSEHNSELKVVLSNGKYLLNSSLANYSFGNLHTVFQNAFSKTNLSQQKINNALILGFGAGSLASILRNELKMNCKITGVEIDEEVIHIAKKYFNADKINDVKIVIDDAQHFLESTNEKFDLIVIDLFQGIEIPEKFYSLEFLNLIKKVANADVSIYFNCVVDNYQRQQKFVQLKQDFIQTFSQQETLQYFDSNKILHYRGKAKS